MVEIKLSDELIKQVELTEGTLPADTESRVFKFDDKGTAHLMCRDGDGKLLRDIPIKEVNYTRSYKDELQEEYTLKHDEFVASNARFKMIWWIILVVLFVLMELCFITIGG